MRLHILVSVAVASVTLSGCATVINGQSQEIVVSTPPTTGAVCTLTNSRGNWQVVSPGTVEVLRSNGNLEAVCKKEGWTDAHASDRPLMSGEGQWNALGLGLIGDGIDASTGAASEYAKDFVIMMTRPAALPAKTGTTTPETSSTLPSPK